MAFNGIMPIDTDAIQPHPYGLFSVPGFVKHTEADNRWVDGFEVEQLLCRSNQSAFMACLPVPSGSESGYLDRTGDGGNFVKRATAFSVVQGVACSTAGLDYDAAVRTAKAVFAAGLQQTAEYALMTGAYSNGLTDPEAGQHPLSAVKNPPAAIMQSAAVSTTDVALGPVPALATLEQRLAQRMPVVNTVHVTPSTATILAASGAIEAVDGVMRTKANGNIVVVGTGYPGTVPEHTTGYTPETGEAENGAVQWMYGTGPLFVHLGEPEVLTPSLKDAVNVENNTSLIVIAQSVAIYWDGCTVASVKTNLY